ncbi:PleD family two-component system response regulator [Paraliomyxa miuraensis]|uniref:hypothetical protein n=1 Tax=Paraliomyxa miuraensis TaxID=376150 RepID=UPI00225362B7|nr:hypothetical protein [Paraliomyxa miuraensis]MCX4242847.1 hypothetical protein [Paraliomyxa miuraensis]
MTVRPYWSRIRTRMVAMMDRAGLYVDEDLKVENGTPDEDAIQQILDTDPDVLLVPFNAHRDAEGKPLDGLTLCRRLSETTGARPLPVLMPVSSMGAAILRLMSTTGVHAAAYADLLADRILVLEEDTLDDPEVPARVVAHVRRISHMGG